MSAGDIELFPSDLDGTFEQMSRRYEFVDKRLSDECGCLEEDWVIGMLYTTIHVEPDGSGHIFIDCGDWDDEKLVDTKSIEELRLAAVDWAKTLHVNIEAYET